MKKRKVLHYSQLPTKLPIGLTLLVLLLLREFNPVGWVHGVAWTFVVFVWIVAIFGIATQEQSKVWE